MDDLQTIHNSNTPSVTTTRKTEKPKSIEIIPPTELMTTEHFIETKYRDMRTKPRLREKQGKEEGTSKIYAEKHRYPSLDTLIQLHSERDTEWLENRTVASIEQRTIVVLKKLTTRRRTAEKSRMPNTPCHI